MIVKLSQRLILAQHALGVKLSNIEDFLIKFGILKAQWYTIWFSSLIRLLELLEPANPSITYFAELIFLFSKKHELRFINRLTFNTSPKFVKSLIW